MKDNRPEPVNWKLCTCDRRYAGQAGPTEDGQADADAILEKCGEPATA